MHVKIQGKNLKITNSLRGHIENKMEKIKFFSDKIVDAHIHLEKIKNEYFGEIIVMLEGKTFRCGKKSLALSEVIDLMTDALEKKIRRTKEIIKDHHNPSIAEASEMIKEDEHHDDDVEDVHIEVHNIDSKPMDDVEALLEFQVEKKPYFAYYEIEKGDDMLSVSIKPHPVFLFKPSGEEFVRYVYLKGDKNVFARMIGGQSEGWYEKRVTEENKKMNIVSKKKVNLPEFNVTAAARELHDHEKDKYIVYINAINGRVEALYKETEHKYALLRYGD